MLRNRGGGCHVSLWLAADQHVSSRTVTGSLYERTSDNRLGSCNAACGRYRRRHQNGSLGRGAGHRSARLTPGSRGVMNRRTLCATPRTRELQRTCGQRMNGCRPREDGHALSSHRPLRGRPRAGRVDLPSMSARSRALHAVAAGKVVVPPPPRRGWPRDSGGAAIAGVLGAAHNRLGSCNAACGRYHHRP